MIKIFCNMVNTTKLDEYSNIMLHSTKYSCFRRYYTNSDSTVIATKVDEKTNGTIQLQPKSMNAVKTRFTLQRHKCFRRYFTKVVILVEERHKSLRIRRNIVVTTENDELSNIILNSTTR